MAQRRRSEYEDMNGGRVRDEQSGRRDESERRVTDDEISARAYELYQQRGAEHGHDWDDWLAAERELQARRRTPGPTPS